LADCLFGGSRSPALRLENNSTQSDWQIHSNDYAETMGDKTCHYTIILLTKDYFIDCDNGRCFL